jgi:hypothetical protein
MSQSDLLVAAVRALDSAGIGYLLTGSLASSLQGEPRATHDADLVVEVAPRLVEAIADAFDSERYFLDAAVAREAVARHGMFNLIDTRTGDKIDFWMLTDDPFDRSRFERRVTEELFGLEMTVSAPEDTLLQKLAWAERSGGSQRQQRDAVGVYEVQAGALDEDYLDRWADVLGVTDALHEVRERAVR